MNSFVSFAGDTLKKQAEALWHMAEDLDGSFDEVIRCLLSISGRIAVSGMGKSGHVARKVAAPLASTGSPAYFIHPAEASHGDLGMMSRHDAVIAFSNSGETAELNDIILFASRHGIPITGVTIVFWPATPIMSCCFPMSRKRALSDALPLRRRRFKWRSEMPLPFPSSRQGDSARRISIGSIRGEGLAGSS